MNLDHLGAVMEGVKTEQPDADIAETTEKERMQQSQYRRSSGRQCCVYACTNNQKKLAKWRSLKCSEHPDFLCGDCPCVQPFRLIQFPRDQVMRKAWADAVMRVDFEPTDYTVICSNHFVDEAPTKENPIPTCDLGYELSPADEMDADRGDAVDDPFLSPWKRPLDPPAVAGAVARKRLKQYQDMPFSSGPSQDLSGKTQLFKITPKELPDEMSIYDGMPLEWDEGKQHDVVRVVSSTGPAIRFKCVESTQVIKEVTAPERISSQGSASKMSRVLTVVDQSTEQNREVCDSGNDVDFKAAGDGDGDDNDGDCVVVRHLQTQQEDNSSPQSSSPPPKQSAVIDGEQLQDYLKNQCQAVVVGGHDSKSAIQGFVSTGEGGDAELIHHLSTREPTDVATNISSYLAARYGGASMSSCKAKSHGGPLSPKQSRTSSDKSKTKVPSLHRGIGMYEEDGESEDDDSRNAPRKSLVPKQNVISTSSLPKQLQIVPSLVKRPFQNKQIAAADGTIKGVVTSTSRSSSSGNVAHQQSTDIGSASKTSVSIPKVTQHSRVQPSSSTEQNQQSQNALSKVIMIGKPTTVTSKLTLPPSSVAEPVKDLYSGLKFVDDCGVPVSPHDYPLNIQSKIAGIVSKALPKIRMANAKPVTIRLRFKNPKKISSEGGSNTSERQTMSVTKRPAETAFVRPEGSKGAYNSDIREIPAKVTKVSLPQRGRPPLNSGQPVTNPHHKSSSPMTQAGRPGLVSLLPVTQAKSNTDAGKQVKSLEPRKPSVVTTGYQAPATVKQLLDSSHASTVGSNSSTSIASTSSMPAIDFRRKQPVGQHHMVSYKTINTPSTEKNSRTAANHLSSVQYSVRKGASSGLPQLNVDRLATFIHSRPLEVGERVTRRAWDDDSFILSDISGLTAREVDEQTTSHVNNQTASVVQSPDLLISLSTGDRRTMPCGLVRVLPSDTRTIKKEYLCNFCVSKTASPHTFINHISSHLFFCKRCTFKSFERHKLVIHMMEKHDETGSSLSSLQCVDESYASVQAWGATGVLDGKSMDLAMPSGKAACDDCSDVFHDDYALHLHKAGCKQEVDFVIQAVLYLCLTCEKEEKNDIRLMQQHVEMMHSHSPMVIYSLKCRTKLDEPAQFWCCPICNFTTRNLTSIFLVKHLMTTHRVLDAYHLAFDQMQDDPLQFILSRLPLTRGRPSNAVFHQDVIQYIIGCHSKFDKEPWPSILKDISQALCHEYENYRRFGLVSADSLFQEKKVGLSRVVPIANFSPLEKLIQIENYYCHIWTGDNRLSPSRGCLLCEDKIPSLSPCWVREHIYGHFGVKLWECSHCRMRFGKRSSLAYHMQTQHGISRSILYLRVSSGDEIADPPDPRIISNITIKLRVISNSDEMRNLSQYWACPVCYRKFHKHFLAHRHFFAAHPLECLPQPIIPLGFNRDSYSYSDPPGIMVVRILRIEHDHKERRRLEQMRRRMFHHSIWSDKSMSGTEDRPPLNNYRWKCRYCHYNEANAWRVRDHMKSLHPSSEPCCISVDLQEFNYECCLYMCPRCDFYSFERLSMISHAVSRPNHYKKIRLRRDMWEAINAAGMLEYTQISGKKLTYRSSGKATSVIEQLIALSGNKMTGKSLVKADARTASRKDGTNSGNAAITAENSTCSTSHNEISSANTIPSDSLTRMNDMPAIDNSSQKMETPSTASAVANTPVSHNASHIAGGPSGLICLSDSASEDNGDHGDESATVKKTKSQIRNRSLESSSVNVPSSSTLDIDRGNPLTVCEVREILMQNDDDFGKKKCMGELQKTTSEAIAAQSEVSSKEQPSSSTQSNPSTSRLELLTESSVSEECNTDAFPTKLHQSANSKSTSSQAVASVGKYCTLREIALQNLAPRLNSHDQVSSSDPAIDAPVPVKDLTGGNDDPGYKKCMKELQRTAGEGKAAQSKVTSQERPPESKRISASSKESEFAQMSPGSSHGLENPEVLQEPELEVPQEIRSWKENNSNRLPLSEVEMQRWHSRSVSPETAASQRSTTSPAGNAASHTADMSDSESIHDLCIISSDSEAEDETDVQPKEAPVCETPPIIVTPCVDDRHNVSVKTHGPTVPANMTSSIHASASPHVSDGRSASPLVIVPGMVSPDERPSSAAASESRSHSGSPSFQPSSPHFSSPASVSSHRSESPTLPRVITPDSPTHNATLSPQAVVITPEYDIVPDYIQPMVICPESDASLALSPTNNVMPIQAAGPRLQSPDRSEPLDSNTIDVYPGAVPPNLELAPFVILPE